MNEESIPPETILLAVTGMSPAVLTETVWALAHEAEPTLPARVIVLTTAAGRERIRRQLFSPDPNLGGRTPWQALRDALTARGHSLKGRLRFGDTPDDLRVFTAFDPVTGLSRELADIRDRADNEAAADFLLEQVRGIVENPDTRLVASLAGGRKTMGALLYACLTLAGRETDRLTHVLVTEPYETLPGFWFPGQPGDALTGRQPGDRYAPADARVDLADVPFVPLRNLFVRELNAKAGTFSRLVDSCRDSIRRRAAETVRLTLETTRPEIEVNGQRVRLAAREQALLWFLARGAKAGRSAFPDYTRAADELNAALPDFQRTATKDDFGDWRHDLRANFDEEAVRKLVSSLRSKLRREGGQAALLVACLPEKGRCSLDMPGAMIFLAGADPGEA